MAAWNCRWFHECGSSILISSLVILVAPDFLHKAAFLEVVDERVVVNFFGLLADRGALLTGKLDGFRDGFAGNNHGAVEDFARVSVVGGLKRFRILRPHGFANGRLGLVGI